VFNDYRMVPEEFIDVDAERVLVFAREGGRGKAAGLRYRQSFSMAAARDDC
jgi:hypothetical protein